MSMMHLILTAFGLLLISTPLWASEKLTFECTLLPMCTQGMDCAPLLPIDLDVAKVGDKWQAELWYQGARSSSWDLLFEELPETSPQENSLFLRSIEGFEHGIDYNMLSIHEDGGAFLTTHTGGYISNLTSYAGNCENNF